MKEVNTKILPYDFTPGREIVAQRVGSRKNGETVRPDGIILGHPWGSAVRIREAGGVLEGLHLVGSDGGLHKVLYSDNATKVAKRNASHIMEPAGPYDGLGGQHGVGRWLDWHTFKLEPLLGGERIAFQAKRGDDGETLGRYIELRGDSFLIESTVRASDEPLETSLGEHFYFATNKELEEIALNGLNIAEFTGDDSAFNKLRAGKALKLPMNIDMLVKMQLFDDQIIEMQTKLFDSSYEQGELSEVPAELWIWRREGAEGYICIEPVVGVEHREDDLHNNLLQLQPGEDATLQTILRIKDPQSVILR